MRLPRGLARFNRVVTNPVQRTWAWLLPPWAVIVHRGRRSGRTYRTPILAWKRGERVAVVLTYGERSDWVRNLLAAREGRIVRLGRSRILANPRVVDATDPELAGLARALGRGLACRVLVAQVGDVAEPTSRNRG